MRKRSLIGLLTAFMIAACAGGQPVVPQGAASTDSAQEAWWANVQSLCGRAFPGRLAQGDAGDSDFRDAAMAMHVRRCTEDRIEIPFFVGNDRSRTWVLTRTDTGLQLQHDHRHEDGSPDDVTLYGGHTDCPGTNVAQHFPADPYSKDLFKTHDMPQSMTNVWSMELEPGVRFSYVLRRANRHFQVDFDLGTTIDPPPAPWGHE